METPSSPKQNTSDDTPILDSAGVPFEITRFRTEKFENHGDDISRVDRCSDDPGIMEILHGFRNVK
jgi:hypothetical protein